MSSDISIESLSSLGVWSAIGVRYIIMLSFDYGWYVMRYLLVSKGYSERRLSPFSSDSMDNSCNLFKYYQIDRSCATGEGDASNCSRA